MTFDQFIVKWTNRYIDFDGYNGAQCMDLYRQYVKEVLAYPQSPALGIKGKASDVWTTYLKDYFDRIPNDPYNFPQKGDIVIWNTNAGGGFGHIAVCVTADSMRFTSFDQNWVQVSAHKQLHNFTNVLGWLRPKKKDIINIEVVEDKPTPAESPQVENPVTTEDSTQPENNADPVLPPIPDPIPDVVENSTTTDTSTIIVPNMVQPVPDQGEEVVETVPEPTPIQFNPLTTLKNALVALYDLLRRWLRLT